MNVHDRAIPSANDRLVLQDDELGVKYSAGMDRIDGVAEYETWTDVLLFDAFHLNFDVLAGYDTTDFVIIREQHVDGDRCLQLRRFNSRTKSTNLPLNSPCSALWRDSDLFDTRPILLYPSGLCPCLCICLLLALWRVRRSSCLAMADRRWKEWRRAPCKNVTFVNFSSGPLNLKRHSRVLFCVRRWRIVFRPISTKFLFERYFADWWN